MIPYRDELLPRLLLHGRWLPMTDTVLFVNAPLDQAAATLVNGVHGQWAQRQADPLSQRGVSGGLEDLLQQFLPLESPQTLKHLLIQTANPDWTALLGSWLKGLDLTSPPRWFRTDGLSSVGITEATSSKSGFQPSRRILYTRPEQQFGDQIYLRWDGSGWDYDGPDDPALFGPGAYDPTARRRPDRFTHDHLRTAAANFGLHPFDADFYAPDRHGILITRQGPPDVPKHYFTLAQARGEEPIDWDAINATTPPPVRVDP